MEVFDVKRLETKQIPGISRRIAVRLHSDKGISVKTKFCLLLETSWLHLFNAWLFAEPYVIYERGVPLGYVCLENNKVTCVVSFVKGFGRALMLFAEDHIRLRGFGQVVLYSELKDYFIGLGYDVVGCNWLYYKMFKEV